MTDKEMADARKALKQWFVSQDIAPPDAGLIMMDLCAELFVQKTRNIDELQDAIKLYATGLTISVVDELKKVN